MSTLIIVDIDGTIADATRRFKEAGPEPARHNAAQYTAWVNDVQNAVSLLADPPVAGMRDMLHALNAIGLVEMVYLTSREEKWHDVTQAWLVENKFPLLPLYMRPDSSMEETEALKERVIRQCKYMFKATDVVVIDDDQQGKIEKMCLKNGYTFLKAMSGGRE